MLSQRHRIIPSTQQSTSTNHLHANSLAVWGDPLLSTIVLSATIDNEAISAEMLVIQELMDLLTTLTSSVRSMVLTSRLL